MPRLETNQQNEDGASIDVDLCQNCYQEYAENRNLNPYGSPDHPPYAEDLDTYRCEQCGEVLDETDDHWEGAPI